MDKFYTQPEIAKICVEYVLSIYNVDIFDSIIEPSAGCGNFLKWLPNTTLAFDIEPADEKITKCNFFDITPHSLNALTIGNPPFGKNSSLAVSFFNHASQFSDVIAFIVPRTFRRHSIQNRLNLYFELIDDFDIPVKSFIPNIQVKCCFQIWQRTQDKRNKVKNPVSHKDWLFVKYGDLGIDGLPTPPADADFAIRAYGGKCGEIYNTNLNKLRAKSWHFIKSNIDTKTLITRFKTLNFSLAENTARQNSLGRADLVFLYSNKYN